MIRLRQRYVSKNPRNKKHQTKTILFIFAIALTIILHEKISDFIISSSYILYPRYDSEQCIDCKINLREYPGVYDNDKTSILLYTMYLNISEIPPSECCIVEQEMFDPTRYSNLKHDKELDYQTRLEYMFRLIKPYHVVMFHVKDMPGARLLKQVSSSRPRDQLWAYYNKESPYNTINVVNGKYDDIFNLTITPLRDSNVFAPYGTYEKKTHKSSKKWFNPNNADVIYNKKTANPDEYFDLKTRILEQNKLLAMNVSFEVKYLAAWVVSNCDELRTKYALALSKYIPLHIYGKCNDIYNTEERICEKDTFACEKQLRKYKFILAFENSFCDDYITEKYWNALVRGNVPIVLGGRNYDEKVVIPASFINARSFKNAKTLAKYMLFVGKNKKEYQKYLQWRDDYIMDYIPNNHHRMDRIITKLHQLVYESSYEGKAYKLSRFYGVRRNCPLHINDTLWKVIGVT